MKISDVSYTELFAKVLEQSACTGWPKNTYTEQSVIPAQKAKNQSKLNVKEAQ